MSGKRDATPVVLCIDVEPDPRKFDRAEPPPWRGLERLAERLPALRERLAELTGEPAAFSWFVRMDPQVAETWGTASWAGERYTGLFGQAVEAGDEIGLHTHTWRWDVEEDGWINDFADPAWQEHCLGIGLEAFERTFGRGCAVHRGGDHFLSGTMLSQLGAAGVRVDLTVEPGFPPQRSPGKDEPARGMLPDYRGVPIRPYRSSPGAFPAPDPAAQDGPLLIPLMSAPGRWPPLVRQPLSPVRRGAIFRSRLALALLRGGPPVISLAILSKASLLPWWEEISANLEHLARRRGIAFTTATDAAERFEEAVVSR